MDVTINRRWLVALAGGLALLAGLILATTNAAGAAEGGNPAGGEFIYVDGAVDSEDRPVFLTTSGFGSAITQCLDSYCRQSTVHELPTVDRGLGFTVADDGRVVILARILDVGPNFEPEDRLIVCSDSSCANIVNEAPAVATGSLHARPNGTMLIVDGTNITQCGNLACTFNVQVQAHGVANFRDVTLDGFTPVFLTDNAVVRCNQNLCQGAETTVPHNIDRPVNISLSPEGLPQITVERSTGDDAFYPELHHCLNAQCTEVDIEILATPRAGRASTFVIGGEPTRAVVFFEGFGVNQQPLLVSTPLRCTATVSGNEITVNFDGDANRASIVRLNGRFIETVTGRDTFSFTADGRNDFLFGPPNDLILRNWTDNEFIDIPCLEETAAPDLSPVCTTSFFDFNDDDGVGAFVEWTNVEPADIVVIRKNNRFLISPEEGITAGGQDVQVDEPDRSIDDFGGRPGDIYVARVWSNSTTFTDVACTVGDNFTQPLCTITGQGANVRINWTNTDDGIVVLRKDGRWLTTPAPGTFSFLDTNASTTSDYLLRFRAEEGPNFTDFTCTPG